MFGAEPREPSNSKMKDDSYWKDASDRENMSFLKLYMWVNVVEHNRNKENNISTNSNITWFSQIERRWMMNVLFAVLVK